MRSTTFEELMMREVLSGHLAEDEAARKRPSIEEGPCMSHFLQGAFV